MGESQWPHNGWGSDITLNILFNVSHRLSELNKILMLACEMGHWDEGGTVVAWVSVAHLEGETRSQHDLLPHPPPTVTPSAYCPTLLSLPHSPSALPSSHCPTLPLTHPPTLPHPPKFERSLLQQIYLSLARLFEKHLRVLQVKRHRNLLTTLPYTRSC